jgi:RecB family exonuclease
MSYSKVAAFRRCRREFWLRYESGVRLEDPMTPSGIVGSGIHKAMKALTETGDRDVAASTLERYLRMPAHASCAEGTTWHDVAFSLFESGCDAHAAIASEDRWAEKDTYRHAPEEGISIRSRIDRVDKLGRDTWQIIDWKTGLREDDDETDSQLDLAHVAFRTCYPHVPAHAVVHAIAWNLRSGRQRTRRLLARDVAPTLREYGTMARRMQETRAFEPTPGPHCRFCPWRERCPEGMAAFAASERRWGHADE